MAIGFVFLVLFAYFQFIDFLMVAFAEHHERSPAAIRHDTVFLHRPDTKKMKEDERRQHDFKETTNANGNPNFESKITNPDDLW